jgi:uncharacterized surface protein with fasciclin (FAS1) repeats
MDTKIIIAIVAVIAVLGIGWYAMMGNKSSMTADSNSTMQTSPAAMQSSPMAQASGNMEKGVMVGGAMMTPDKDIVDNAVNSKDHTTVVAAVKAAGLVETLKGDGPFTVFAPTNEAFAKLPSGTVETLLKPENKTKLTGVLTYHVVPGAYRAADLKDGMTLKTVNGQMLTFSMKDGKWWINNSAIVTIGDVISSNGVTHVIDTVLMPK